MGAQSWNFVPQKSVVDQVSAEKPSLSLSQPWCGYNSRGSESKVPALFPGRGVAPSRWLHPTFSPQARGTGRYLRGGWREASQCSLGPRLLAQGSGRGALHVSCTLLFPPSPKTLHRQLGFLQHRLLSCREGRVRNVLGCSMWSCKWGPSSLQPTATCNLFLTPQDLGDPETIPSEQDPESLRSSRADLVRWAGQLLHAGTCLAWGVGGQHFPLALTSQHYPQDNPGD